MRVQSLLRKLIPASIVALVLAFSYFAPALGLVAPAVSGGTGVGVNCGRFGYGYHGGKHLMPCPNPVYPSPANQPLGGVAPRPVSPQRPSTPPTPVASTSTAPPALALRPSVVPQAANLAPAPAPTPPQALGQVRQTGALGRLSAEPSLAAALLLLVIAVVSFSTAIVLRLRRRRRP
jgi:hypothetical protein